MESVTAWPQAILVRLEAGSPPMMNRLAKLAIAAAATATLGTSVAQAVTVELVYNGTVASFNGDTPPGAAVGDPITFIVALDNGGSDLVSQTYDGTSFQSASVSVGSYDGAVGALNTTASFTVTTDAAGNLATLDILTGVSGTGTGGVFPTFLALNGRNVVLGLEDLGSFLSGVNAVIPPTLQNTSIGLAAQVPLPATAYLLACALAGLAALRRGT